jgi:hypothetical protein
MSLFRRKKGLNTTKCTLFDQKLLIHASDSIAGILYEIRNVPQGTKVTLQWLSTVPVEKEFGVTRMHAGRHPTLTAIIKTMEVDAAMRFVYRYIHLKNRRFA